MNPSSAYRSDETPGWEEGSVVEDGKKDVVEDESVVEDGKKDVVEGVIEDVIEDAIVVEDSREEGAKPPFRAGVSSNEASLQAGPKESESPAEPSVHRRAAFVLFRFPAGELDAGGSAGRSAASRSRSICAKAMARESGEKNRTGIRGSTCWASSWATPRDWSKREAMWSEERPSALGAS